MPQARASGTANRVGAGGPAGDFSYSPYKKTVGVVFSPGSEGLSLASCGLGQTCGTHRRGSPIWRTWVLLPTPVLPWVPEVATGPGSQTSTPVTCSLKVHLREGRRSERSSEECLGLRRSTTPSGPGRAAQAGEQGTKSKRSWNALETTAAFGIPLPAVQPLGRGVPSPRARLEPLYPGSGGRPRSRQ